MERFHKGLRSVAEKRQEDSDQQGGGAMPQDPKPKEKVEEENQRDIKTTRESRQFRKPLKQVIKAQPMNKEVAAESDG